MKTPKLTQPKAILLGTLTTLAVFFAIVPQAQAQDLVKFPDCLKTRLGCLDKKPPIVPVDQPVVIQVGLKTNIKCEAFTFDKKIYAVDLHLTKKIQASENQELNYYLVPGKHGLLNFEINEVGAPDVQYVLGEYVFHSDIEAIENGLAIKSVDHRATRVGGTETTTEIILSNSVQGQPLKIFSAKQTIVQESMFDEKPKVSTKYLSFSESNCVYY